MASFSVYSLADTKAVLSHPNVGQCSLHQGGTGKIVISASGDLSSHTTTANGFVVVNRLKSENGVVTIEVPQNSAADSFPLMATAPTSGWRGERIPQRTGPRTPTSRRRAS